ncbi:hypothetical protein HHL17_20995 [Chitinophaga sp. G-6-1-13]|uniref:Uncharacterized protein n=1 Tax=Chitinophaga fulva TaxID=2728842 RepID=A0A848GST1_9BACT|nr:hypothetical protein [Chitinophaga fulva]NML39690.1 hypothetical protein [Chitinophaga fulva]
MGSMIEINDTLVISTEQGFPDTVLDLGKHIKEPVTIDQVSGKIFSFYKKERARIYQSDPVRVYLVQYINGKWLFWGKIYIQSQRIDKKLDAQGNWKADDWETSGTFIITDLYEPAYQQEFTKRESPAGKSYF